MANGFDPRQIEALVMKKSAYRSILNTCQQPASIGIIWADMPGNKMGWEGLWRACDKLVAANLLTKILPKDFSHRGTRYSTTVSGVKMLKKWRSKKSNHQYITGVDIPKV
jgi:hypothetical protein